MTPASDKPDLRRLAEVAFAEVLDTLFSLPATVRASANDLPVAADEISSSVILTGPRLSGSVHLQLPQAFVSYAVRRLAGLEDDAENNHELQDDAAGELANMVAGRVAARLAAAGYPCQLHTPSVSRGARLAMKNQDGVAGALTHLVCEGHWLSLEIHCCYAEP